MTFPEEKKLFEKEQKNKIYESSKLTFSGVDGYTVYNCSIPFSYKGRDYIYGRVEKADKWASSVARLFEKTGKDTYKAVDNVIYQLEDPYLSVIQGEYVLGGTHVRKTVGKIDTYYGYFYRGRSIEDLEYFTTGPDYMKDIRLVNLKNGEIGVFSRARDEETRARYGSESMVGFVRIKSLDELTAAVISSAKPVFGIFDKDEWGGCNQAYLLASGRIGVIGHQSFTDKESIPETALKVYTNIAFEFDPETFEVSGKKIIATRSSYPKGPSKVPDLVDCAFTSGIAMRPDGRVDLYSGISDYEEGRVVIDYPFSSPLAD